ncbi:MAG: hypothetical protein EA416_09930 [Trueperaceae bacterium]|nr:MAG: hypothetical protein EA416_09930 [Trueperaceae bacterium]
MHRTRFVIAITAMLTLAACVPGFGPFLRNVDGQTWAARFDVTVGLTGGPTLRLPVDLEITFRQRFTDVTADASLSYNVALFRLQTGSFVALSGRLGLDDGLSLDSPNRVLAFDGRFVDDRLIGTVSIAGVAPVGDVVFTRVR